MEKVVITPEQYKELKTLWADYSAANDRVKAALRTDGVASDAFLKADREAADALKRIRQILGNAGQHWMA